MGMLNLETLKIIGQGGYKLVYEHPVYSDRVIKVMRPERVAADGGFTKHGPLKRNSLQGVYRQFRREIIQYLQLCKNNYLNHSVSFPIETPLELVMTSKGVGLVVEKILAPDGSVKSLASIVENKEFTEAHSAALDSFFEDCKAMHVVYGEVNPYGIMYTESRNGRPEFVLVDGIGEKLLVPVRSWFKWNNDRYINKVEIRIKKQLGIQSAKACTVAQ